MLIISAESHTDHGLTQAHADWLVRHFAGKASLQRAHGAQ